MLDRMVTFSTDNEAVSAPIQPKDLLDKVGEEVELSGAVHRVREMSWGGFALLRTGQSMIQVVLTKQQLQGINKGDQIKVSGEVKIKRGRGKNPQQEAEISCRSITKLSGATVEPTLDISTPTLPDSMDLILSERLQSLRHPAERAVFQVQAEIARAFREFLTGKGFTEIFSPKIVGGNAEGGANVFGLEYFGQAAFLAQSPQFYKQFMVPVHGRVFEVGPVFRAEQSRTSRHLATYTSMDVEMGYIDGFEDVMQVEAALLQHVVRSLGSNCEEALALLKKTGVMSHALPDLSNGIPAIPFADAKRLIKDRFGKESADDHDLEPEDERLIAQAIKEKTGSEFVFVTKYPWAKRPFYTMRDSEDPTVTNSFDLLFRGLEVTTGGQRIHNHADQIDAMKDKGLDPSGFEEFLKLHQLGTPPHGGLGLGLERLTMQLTGMDNVKRATLFPRDMQRLTP